MARARSLAGYVFATLSVFIMILAILAWTVFPWGSSLASAMGLQHSANWTGGEVVRTIEHGAYRTEIHRPVFDALVGEHSEGFVQVAWAPPDTLPSRVDEEVDFDGDGRADFGVGLETTSRQASLVAFSPDVIGLEGVYRLKGTLAIRVELRNARR